MIHFTSDTHFGHKNIINFQRHSFSNVKEMDEALINNWNNSVEEDDTVYHLGDVAFCNPRVARDILECLNGNLVLLLGNHDKMFRKEGFAKNLLTDGIVQQFIHPCHNVKVDSSIFVLNHFAQRVWDRQHYGVMHLYGHSHGSLPGIGKSVDVGVDSKEMAEFTGGYLRPWSILEVTEFLDTKEYQKVDHH